LLQRLVEEMEQRDAEGRCEPRLVVVLDEMADLMQVGGREMERALTRLTQRGREAGLHLVACTQKPAAAVIGGLVKSNFPVRLVGSVASPEDAKVATGLAGTGAERLLGQGDFVVVAKGQVTRMQAAYLDSKRLRLLVSQLQVGSTPLLPSGGSAEMSTVSTNGPLGSLARKARSRVKRITSGSIL
jgi:S-DNA-T family DNA segregation ATPase FtsK/SpoIIIE